ncbi:MAG: bifunctional sugar-1-phosphate nucleotidylyltransferase/acetyltransferase [Candidatus Thermoplasmatota archaeon]
MKAVILAAGEGRRLRPFTETMPKVMLPVANKPILEHVVDALKNSGIDKVVIVVGYKKESIQEHFKYYTDVDIDFVTQEKQLGTAHALLQAKEKIKDDFLVLSGDNIVDSDSILKLMEVESRYSMLIKKNPDPSKYGMVKVQNNILKNIVEKPIEETGKCFISTGIYKFPSSIFDRIEKMISEGVMDLSSVVQSLVKDKKQVSVHKAGLWMDIVYPWDLIDVNEVFIQDVSGSTGGSIEKNVVMKGPVSVGADTKIYSGCYIVGPVVIGEGCEIGPNCCIFPSTVIGDNTVVRPFSEIRNSVVMNDVHIGSNSFLTHSVVGRDCFIGNNFSNLLGGTTVEVEEEYVKLDDVGVMIGENSEFESHVVVEPGVIIGRNCQVDSLKKIDRKIDSDTKVM